MKLNVTVDVRLGVGVPVALGVPLDVADLPPGMEVTALGVEAVVVRVQGLRHVLDRLDERELRAQLSLRHARAGDVVARVRPEDVTVPRGVEVLRVTPAQVRATVEPVGGTAPK